MFTIHQRFRNRRKPRLFAIAAALITTSYTCAATPDVPPRSTKTSDEYPVAGLEPHIYKSRLRVQLGKVDAATRRGPFHPDWNSLAAYRTPDWFRDAKFGIFIHWGVYSVPAFANEWYSRNMYVPGSPAYEHHRAVYGSPSVFGYKDFIPLFTAAKFDPNAWLDLFVRAGARYVVPVAEHCDGFAMYDSQLTAWNAAALGPKRDIIAELARATRSRGLRFGVSLHRAEHWWWYHEGTQSNSDVSDPRYADLYGPAAPMTLPADTLAGNPESSHLERWLPPSKSFLEDWLARASELVDRFHPDLLYLDWWVGHPGFAPYLQRLAAYYYDEPAASGDEPVAGGDEPVAGGNEGATGAKAGAAREPLPVLTYKQEAFPSNTAVLDVEGGRLDTLRLQPWQGDASASLHSWGYVEHDEYRGAGSVLSELIDVVSKNGNFLLNIGPRSDGSIPPQAQELLLSIGAWLEVNGEAIYGTRPWVLYGEGPTNATTAQRGLDPAYTPADLRFTVKGEILYALGLVWPKEGQVLLKTLYSGSPYLQKRITHVALLGSAATLRWEQTATGLLVQLPVHAGENLPYALKIAF